MNLRDLHYLVTVAETLHFGRAAERCFVSQPTLSGQIKKLEEDLGVTLFERSNRRVSLTPIGAKIVTHAQRILGEMDTIKQIGVAQQDPLAGELRLGAIPTLCPYLIPFVAPAMAKELPKVHLSFAEELTHNLLGKLRRHELDAGFIATAVDENDFKVIPLFREPFWLATPKSHALNKKIKLDYKDLHGLEVLLLADGHCLADQVMELCCLDTSSSTANVGDFRATSLETLLQLVSAGHGSTLVPALAKQHSNIDGRKLHLRELKLRRTHRQISLVYRSTFPRQELLHSVVGLIQSRIHDKI